MSDVDPRLEEFLAFHQARDKRHVVAGLSDKVRDAVRADDANLAASLAVKIGYSIGADIAMLMRQRDRSRRLGKQRETQQKKVQASAKAKLACDLFGQYAASDIEKLGKARIEKEIGEVLRLQFGLAKPVAPRTVREYLRKSGSG